MIRRSLALIALSAVALSLNACGPMSSSTDKHGIAKMPASTYEEARSLALKSSVLCDNLSDCPAQVGMLAMANSDSAAACTFTMVTGDTLVTNSHCIAPDLRHDGASCAGRLWATFPATATLPSSQAECDQILTASQLPAEDKTLDDVLVPDYAVVKLKQDAGRGSIGISRAMLSASDKIQVYPVDPELTSEGFKGVLQSLSTCEMDSANKLIQGKSSIVALEHCRIIHGNSGSALIVNGKVKGVIYGYMPVNQVRGFATTFESVPLPSAIFE